MQLIHQAEHTLAEIAVSIDKDPVSWESWHCLHLEIPGEQGVKDPEFIEEHVATLLAMYMDDADSRAFVCANGDMYVLCKQYSIAVLREIGMHVSDLYYAKYAVHIGTAIYDLYLEGIQFSKMFLRRTGQTNLAQIVSDDSKKLQNANGIIHSIFKGKKEELTVLVADDDLLALRLVSRLLGDQCKLECATSGSEAIQKYRVLKPDLLLLDIHMPDRDGRDVLREIRQHYPDAFIVMFSGNDTIETITEVLASGATGFVAKPFRKQKLMHYLNRCLDFVNS